MGLQNCCGCKSLKEGSKAIGITYLVLSALSAMSYTWQFIKNAQDSRTEPEPVYLYVISYGQLLLYVVFNSLLIHGVNSSSRGMVLAWLIFHGIAHGIQSVLIVVLIILGIAYHPLFFLASAILAGFVALFWYWFAVVLAHYNEMMSNGGVVYQQHAMEKR